MELGLRCRDGGVCKGFGGSLGAARSIPGHSEVFLVAIRIMVYDFSLSRSEHLIRVGFSFWNFWSS